MIHPGGDPAVRDPEENIKVPAAHKKASHMRGMIMYRRKDLGFTKPAQGVTKKVNLTD
jgi:hypothetical protein